MTTFCIVLVLLSATMHAGWNLICKSRNPSGAFFLLATTSSLLFLTPVIYLFFPLTRFFPPIIWLLLIVTGTVQALYYIGLGNAYRCCELSIAYPLARALPVLFVPITMLICGLGKVLPLTAVAGMVLVTAGCITLPLTSNLKQIVVTIFSKGYLFILLAALGTTCYTIIDSEALRLIRQHTPDIPLIQLALLYLSLETICIEILLLAYVSICRSERSQLGQLMGRHLWQPLVSGVICTSSYCTILLSMMLVTNVSYIAAFRQASIPLGALLGILLFKEKLSVPKLAGIALIFCGLVIIALV